MKKGFVGFIFGVVSVIAVFLGIIKKMSNVTNVMSHLKDDLSEGFRYLIFGENDTTKLRKYSGRYPFNSYYNTSDDSYYYRGPYNEYSASFKYSTDRQNAIEALVFDTEEEASDIFEKLVEVSDGKKLTVEQFIEVADPNGDHLATKYLDSKFGWWYNEFFNNCIRIEKDDHDETYHFIISRPICLGEDAK